VVICAVRFHINSSDLLDIIFNSLKLTTYGLTPRGCFWSDFKPLV